MKNNNYRIISRQKLISDGTTRNRILYRLILKSVPSKLYKYLFETKVQNRHYTNIETFSGKISNVEGPLKESGIRCLILVTLNLRLISCWVRLPEYILKFSTKV